MRVTKKQAEDFVHFGEDHYSNLKILKDMKYVYLGAAWFLWFIFAVADRGLVPCIIMTVLALVYNVAFDVLKSNRIKKTYRLRFLTNSCSVIYMYLIFYLFPIFFLGASDEGITVWQVIELTVCFIAFPILNALLTLMAVKKDKYDKEKPRKNVGVAGWAFVGGVVGMSISRILDSFLSQTQEISFMIFIVEILLLLISLATPNILRLYFAHKYDIVASIEGETTSELLVYDSSKTTIGKRVFKTILKIFIFGFAIFMLYGMSQVS